MNFLMKFLNNVGYNISILEAEKIIPIVGPYIRLISTITSDKIKREVTRWDLENETLLKYLGYIAGAIDAAESIRIDKSKPLFCKIRDLVFLWQIKENLDWLDGVDVFLHLGKMDLEEDRLTIDGLQSQFLFFEAMIYGGNDYLRGLSGEPGFYPIGLIELGLISGGSENQ